MANVTIPELNALTAPSPSDLVPVADVSTANDEVKKTTVGEIVGIITGDVEVASDGTATISELPVSKLQDGNARQLLQTAANGTDVEWTDDVELPGTLGVTGQSTLASAAISDLTSGRVVLAGASGEIEDSANLVFDGSELGITGTLDVSSNGTIGGDLTVVGDLTVEGATTTLETQTVTVEDKNIELGVVNTPSDATADGGGLTLKGSTDKTINWIDATDAWTFSEHVDIASAKEFRIAGTKVLDATSLGSAVVSSSLTSVGTIATGTWEGTAIDASYLDSTVVTTSDTGTVTSTMILDGTIVDDDISASAAIAGTKINPDFGSQTVETGDILVADGSRMEIDEIRAKDGAGLKLFDDGGAGIFIKDGGNVGLGTTSPGSPLTTYTDSPNTDNTAAVCELRNTDTTPVAGTDNINMLRIVTNTSNGNTAALIGLGKYENSSNSRAELKLKLAQTALSSSLAEFSFRGDGQFTAPGKVGIGITSASSLLHLADAGDITVGTTTGTKIGTATSQKIGFYNATPVVQPTAVADITTTATSGSLPTPDGSVTIADAATPTVTELLEYCVELEAKLEAALGRLRTLGLIAT